MPLNRLPSFLRGAMGASAVCLLAACAAPADDAPVVELRSPDDPVAVAGGEIRGAVSDRNADILAFKGIPFAAPPVGDLRWRPPESVVAWDGVRDATEAGAICVQAAGLDSGQQSEDCLFLNVWTPRESTEPLPVMVWIHGGGYTGGASSTPLYDGTQLAADGAVLVSINYRLNVFGFLAHPALSAESAHDASGNYGLMDMVAALEWVRDNIATFGGDPSRVTIFGESAGAGAVMSVMLIPQAEGLYHRAIAESNWIHGWDRPLREADRGWEPAEAQGVRIAEALGGTGDDALATMRDATATDVLEASNTGAGSPFLRAGNVWAPNIDGWIIPDDPLAMYDSGRQHDVPLITGMNGNEGSLMTTAMDIADADAFEAHIRGVYPMLATEALAHYDVHSAESAKAGIDHVVHDMYFAGPVRAHARTHANVSSPAWLYQFTHVPPTAGGAAMGSHHAAELAYVFGTLTPRAPGQENPGILTPIGDFTDVDMQLSETIRSYWVQFAATGDPNRADLPAWPSYDAATDEHLVLGEVVVAGTRVHEEGALLWDAFEAYQRDSN